MKKITSFLAPLASCPFQSPLEILWQLEPIFHLFLKKSSVY